MDSDTANLIGILILFKIKKIKSHLKRSLEAENKIIGLVLTWKKKKKCRASTPESLR